MARGALNLEDDSATYGRLHARQKEGNATFKANHLKRFKLDFISTEQGAPRCATQLSGLIARN